MLGLYSEKGRDDADESSVDSLGDTPSLRGLSVGVEK